MNSSKKGPAQIQHLQHPATKWRNNRTFSFPVPARPWRLVLIKLSLFSPHESVFLPVLIDNSIDIWPLAWRRFHLWSLRWSTCLTNCTCLTKIQSACLCASISLPVFQKVQASYRRFVDLTDSSLHSDYLLKLRRLGREPGLMDTATQTDEILWWRCSHITASGYLTWYVIAVTAVSCSTCCTLSKIILSICLTCSRNYRNMCHLKIYLMHCRII